LWRVLAAPLQKKDDGKVKTKDERSLGRNVYKRASCMACSAPVCPTIE